MAVGDQAMTGNGHLRLIPLTSTRFLDSFAETVLAQCMLEQGLIAKGKMEGAEADSADTYFYKGKIETVRYFCRNVLTNVFGRMESLRLRDTSALDIPERAFL
jgi:3-(methylthio)propanoyl-CoA dehydrogenase